MCMFKSNTTIECFVAYNKGLNTGVNTHALNCHDVPITESWRRIQMLSSPRGIQFTLEWCPNLGELTSRRLLFLKKKMVTLWHWKTSVNLLYHCHQNSDTSRSWHVSLSINESEKRHHFNVDTSDVNNHSHVTVIVLKQKSNYVKRLLRYITSPVELDGM